MSESAKAVVARSVVSPRSPTIVSAVPAATGSPSPYLRWRIRVDRVVAAGGDGGGERDAAHHQLEGLAGGDAVQAGLAAADGRTPANLIAAKAVSDPVLKAFSAAGIGGIPMPNVPQMGSVWGALGGAWVNSTKGAGAMPAQKAFAQAQATVKKAIG